MVPAGGREINKLCEVVDKNSRRGAIGKYTPTEQDKIWFAACKKKQKNMTLEHNLNILRRRELMEDKINRLKAERILLISALAASVMLHILNLVIRYAG